MVKVLPINEQTSAVGIIRNATPSKVCLGSSLEWSRLTTHVSQTTAQSVTQ